jgi:hypothetical protein
VGYSGAVRDLKQGINDDQCGGHDVGTSGGELGDTEALFKRKWGELVL